MTTSADATREAVRQAYDTIARADASGCGCGCGPEDSTAIIGPASTRMGYSQEELDILPDGADLGLGCGNPQAIAALQPGETVTISAVAPASTASWPPGRSPRPVT